MSSTLFWRPAEEYGKELPDELKYKLQEMYPALDADIHLTRSDLGYLKGLKQCGVKGAATLIAAIEQHKEIIVRERWL